MKDFDKAWNEKEGDGYPFKVKGVEYELPPEVPAGVVLESMRLEDEYEEGEPVPAKEVTKIAERLFGREDLDEMLNNGIGINELRDLVDWANSVYTPDLPTEGDGSGNADN